MFEIFKVIFLVAFLFENFDSSPLTASIVSSSNTSNLSSTKETSTVDRSTSLHTKETTLIDLDTNLSIGTNDAPKSLKRNRRHILGLLSNLFVDFELKIHKAAVAAPVITTPPPVAHRLNFDYYHYHNHGPIRTYPHLVKETYIGFDHNVPHAGQRPTKAEREPDEKDEWERLQKSEKEITKGIGDYEKDDEDEYEDDDEEDNDDQEEAAAKTNNGQGTVVVVNSKHESSVKKQSGQHQAKKELKIKFNSKFFQLQRQKLKKLKLKISSIKNDSKRIKLLHELNLSLERLIHLKKNAKLQIRKSDATKISSTKNVKKTARKSLKNKKKTTSLKS